MSIWASGRSVLQLILVTLGLLVLPLAAISLIALETYERHLLPELVRKAETVGTTVAERVERALGVGIPLGSLVGMREFLEPVISEAPDLAYIAVADRDGLVLHAGGLSTVEVQQLLLDRGLGGEDEGLVAHLHRAVAVVVDRIEPRPDGGGTRGIRIGPYIDVAVPVHEGGAVVGELHVGVLQAFVRQQLEDIVFDIGILLLVGLLIAFELLVLVVSTNLTAPLASARQLMHDARAGRFKRIAPMPDAAHAAGRFVDTLSEGIEQLYRRQEEIRRRAGEILRRGDAAARAAVAAILAQLDSRYTFAEGGPHGERRANLITIRLLAFLFVFAEELARPFLPVYIAQRALEVPAEIADPAFLVGAPISLFMLVGAFTMAFGALWSDTAGRRRTFATGAVISTIGLVGTALAGSFVELLVWRGLSGMGYGLTFVACQGYVIDRTTPANRAQGVSMFVGGVLAADICGPAVGGILADRIGFEATLLIGAGVAALAGILVFRLMEAQSPERSRPQIRRSLGAGLGGALGNWRFVAVIVLAGMPSKLILTGVLFYLVPLQLTALGSTQSEIGRIAMTYGIAALLLTPIFALIADRTQTHGAMVGLGGILSGVGMLPVLFAEDPGSVFVAVLLLGLGQAMSLSSLLTFTARVSQAEIARLGQAPVLGTFRLFERIGSALGPFVVAAFVIDFGYAGAMALAGVLAIASAVGFSTLFLIAGEEPEPAFAEPIRPMDQRVEP